MKPEGVRLQLRDDLLAGVADAWKRLDQLLARELGRLRLPDSVDRDMLRWRVESCLWESGLHNLEDDGKLVPYCVTIAARLATRDARRARRCFPVKEVADPRAHLFPLIPEDCEEIACLLERLSAQEQCLLIVTLLGTSEGRNAAQELGISLATYRQRKARLRARVRSLRQKETR